MFSLLLTAAWDAVGVGEYTPPPPPPPPIEFDYDPAMFTGTKQTDQKIDTSGDSQVYYMSVSPGSTVTCSTTGNNGDADLYVRRLTLLVIVKCITCLSLQDLLLLALRLAIMVMRTYMLGSMMIQMPILTALAMIA